MSARIPTEMSNLHREAQKLLPWYVNGTLADEEREALRKHLGECLTCRAAHREALGLLETFRDQQTIPVGRDEGLSELLQRIDLTRHGGHRIPVRLPLPGNRRAVAVGILLVIVAVAFWRGQIEPAPEGEFSTLFDTTGGASDRIDLIFSEPLEPYELEQMLHEIEGTIVSGPTNLGRYTIALDLDDQGSVADVLDALSRDPRVRFAGRAFAVDASHGGEAR